MRRFLFALVAAALLTSCGSGITPQRYCYTICATTVHSVDLGMKVAGDLYRAGKLSDATKDKLIAAHDVYRPLAEAAVTGCEAVTTQAAADEQAKKIQAAGDEMIGKLVAAGA